MVENEHSIGFWIGSLERDHRATEWFVRELVRLLGLTLRASSKVTRGQSNASLKVRQVLAAFWSAIPLTG